MTANTVQRWSPTSGYGEGEAKFHPMISGTEKLVVDYNYSGPDAVLINRNFMPIPASVINYLVSDKNVIKAIRWQAYSAGILYCYIQTPLLYALFYSPLSIPDKMSTLIICEGYERMLVVARAKHEREENPEIAKALAELDVEMTALFEELAKKINDPAFDLSKRTVEMENAIVELLFPFTITYIAILERCCWRLYAKFTKREHAFRPSTVPSCVDPQPDQNENCLSHCQVMRKKWKVSYGDEVDLEDNLGLSDEAILGSRYYYGVNVAQALFLFDYYRQDSSVELIEKK